MFRSFFSNPNFIYSTDYVGFLSATINPMSKVSNASSMSKPNRAVAVILSVLISFISHGQVKDFGKRVAYTQYATSGAEAVLSELLVKNLGKPVDLYDKGQVKGSPYFDDEFSRGLVFYEGELVDTLFLRYNAYQDEIQIKNLPNSQDSIHDLLKNTSISCRLNNISIEYRDFTNEKKKVQSAFLFKLVQGKKYDLYIRKVKKLKPGKKSLNSLAQSIDPKFVSHIEYYMSTPKSELIVQIPKRKQKILKLFLDGDKDVVESAISQFSFDKANENMLAQLFRSLNDR